MANSVQETVGAVLLMLESDATEAEVVDFLDKNHPNERDAVLQEVANVWSQLKVNEAVISQEKSKS